MTSKADDVADTPDSTPGADAGSGPKRPQPDAPTSPSSGSGDTRPAATQPAKTPISQQVGRVIMVSAAALFGIFAVFNSQYVDLNWVFGGTEVTVVGGERVSGGVRLIILLIAAFGLGLTVGYLAAFRTGRRKLKAVAPKKR